MSIECFSNRTEAGRLLAKRLISRANDPDTIVLGLPRGGIPVAFEVATALKVPLDVFVVRKLSTPGNRELAMGAIAEGGVRVLNTEIVQNLEIPEHVVAEVTEEEERELRRRAMTYRGQDSSLTFAGKTVILVDDGVATGSTMRAAIQAIRLGRPGRIVVAVPTIARSTYRELRPEVDELVAILIPDPFFGVGQWYTDFRQTTDSEVVALLSQARSLRERNLERFVEH